MEEEIEQAWNEYKETIQDSTYMQRITLSKREEDFKAGYLAALKNNKKSLDN